MFAARTVATRLKNIAIQMSTFRWPPALDVFGVVLIFLSINAIMKWSFEKTRWTDSNTCNIQSLYNHTVLSEARIQIDLQLLLSSSQWLPVSLLSFYGPNVHTHTPLPVERALSFSLIMTRTVMIRFVREVLTQNSLSPESHPSPSSVADPVSLTKTSRNHCYDGERLPFAMFP